MIRAGTALDAAVRQLNAAVAEQERAVTRILGLVEVLLEHAPDRVTRARLDGILETCGFQDTTGQRIQRVAGLLRHLSGDLSDVPVSAPVHGSAAARPTEDGAAGDGLSQEEVDRLLNVRR